MCIPAARIEEVIAAAKDVAAAEDRIRRAVEDGLSLVRAREQNAYHRLQTATQTGGKP